MQTTDATTPSDVRTSTLIGDRLCIKCGYNLVGQPILREGHYDMLIVRCPECATVASVQEYPLLGRWANRWAALLASCWFLAMVVLWLGSAGTLFGFAAGSAELAADEYGDVVYQRFNEWQAQQAANVTPNAPSGQIVFTNASGVVTVRNTPADFTAWWQAQDRAAMLRDAGGVFGGLSWFVAYIWMWLTIVAVALGVAWATLLIARGRLGLLAWGAIVMLSAAVIGLIPLMDWLSSKPTWTQQAAAQQIAPTVFILSLLWGGMWMAVGLMVGRSVTRGLARLMLPPRMRSSLAFLWLTDGLQPPTTK